MTNILTNPISKELKMSLNITDEREKYIKSYIRRMIKDYKGHPIHIIKEIPLNLKGDERYFAMFLTGNYFAPLFNKMNEIERTEFMVIIADALKFDNESIQMMSEYMTDTVRIQIRENIPTSKMIKDVIDSKFNDKEKDYIIFTLGII